MLDRLLGREKLEAMNETFDIKEQVVLCIIGSSFEASNAEVFAGSLRPTQKLNPEFVILPSEVGAIVSSLSERGFVETSPTEPIVSGEFYRCLTERGKQAIGRIRNNNDRFKLDIAVSV